MTRHVHRGFGSLYAVAILAVLAFGIREAAAAPAAKKAAACTPADHLACAEWCDSMGWLYDYAVCTQYGCECRIRMCGNGPC
jgi:hypothetical protein